MDALDGVHDPCSMAMNSPMSLVHMGLVDTVTVRGCAVEIELLLTDPMCFFLKGIFESVQDAVGAVAGVDSVAITLSHRELWTRERIGTARPVLRDRPGH